MQSCCLIVDVPCWGIAPEEVIRWLYHLSDICERFVFFFTMILGDQESRVNQLLYTQATFTLLVLLGLNDEKTSSNVLPMKKA